MNSRTLTILAAAIAMTATSYGQLGATPGAAKEEMKSKFLNLLDDKLPGKDEATKPSQTAAESAAIESALKPELDIASFPVGLLAVSRTGPKMDDVRVQIMNRYNGGSLFAKIGDPITFRRIDRPETWKLVRIIGNELLMESDNHRVKIYKEGNVSPLVPPWLTPEQIAAMAAAREKAKTQQQAAAPQAGQPQQVQHPASSLPTFRAGGGIQRPQVNRGGIGSQSQKGTAFKNSRIGGKIGNR